MTYQSVIRGQGDNRTAGTHSRGQSQLRGGCWGVNIKQNFLWKPRKPLNSETNWWLESESALNNISQWLENIFENWNQDWQVKDKEKQWEAWYWILNCQRQMMEWKCPTYKDLTFYDRADNANVQFLIFKSWPLTIRDLEANSRRSKWLSLVDLNGSRTHRRHACAGKACREYKCRILHIRKRSTLGPPSAPCPFSNLYLKNSHSQAIKCLTSVQIIF